MSNHLSPPEPTHDWLDSWCPSCSQRLTTGPSLCMICDGNHGPFQHPTPREREVSAELARLKAILADLLKAGEWALFALDGYEQCRIATGIDLANARQQIDEGSRLAIQLLRQHIERAQTECGGT